MFIQRDIILESLHVKHLQRPPRCFTFFDNPVSGLAHVSYVIEINIGNCPFLTEQPLYVGVEVFMLSLHLRDTFRPSSENCPQIVKDIIYKHFDDTYMPWGHNFKVGNGGWQYLP